MTTMNLQDAIRDRLADKAALITGGAGNIGLETASRFLLEGARVALVDINNEALQDATASLESKHGSLLAENRILCIPADVTSESAVEAFVQETVKHFGFISCAFLCAGVSYSSTNLLETSVEQYDRVMTINCRSTFLGIKHVGIAMRDLKIPGSIIIASSIAGLRATPGLIAYSAAKYALRGMCVTAAAELGLYNIRVNTIHPCGVNTPMFLATWPEAKMRKMLEAVPLGRWANVEDIAAVVAFLASNDSQFMTGGALKIDGGAVSF